MRHSHKIFLATCLHLFSLLNISNAESLEEKINKPLIPLNQPQWYSGIIKVPLQVTANSSAAKNRVRHGFGLLHSGWDFEAYRNFAAALKLDPNCLTALTGLLYLSASPDSLCAPFQDEILERTSSLSDSKNAGSFVYTEQERSYASAISLMIRKGRLASSEVLKQITARHPNDLQAEMLLKVFTPRTTGNLGEQIGNHPSDEIAPLIKKYKYNPLPWVYWLAFNQNQSDQDLLKSKILPVASTLAKWDPNMPTWQITLGQFQMRAGMHDQADKTFKNALKIYSTWATRNRVPIEYNDGYWRASIYQITNLYEFDKFDEAVKLATQLTKQPVDPTARTRGTGLFLWEGQTLACRLYIARNKKGDLQKALESLPSKDVLETQKEFTAAPIYIEGLMAYIGTKRALEAKDKSGTDALIQRLRKVLDKMEKSKEDLSGFSDKANFIRCYDALNLYHAEASALAAKQRNDTTSYRLWVESARERQENSRRHLSIPPHVIQDMSKLPK